jgi:hypothetical protein
MSLAYSGEVFIKRNGQDVSTHFHVVMDLVGKKALWMLFKHWEVDTFGDKVKTLTFSTNNPMKDVIGAGGWDITRILEDAQD